MAQTPPPINNTNFGMVGITRGQTLQINLVAYPPDPCFAQLGFQNSSGNPVGASQTVSLQPGQSASLTINGNTLTDLAGQRVQLLPTVTPIAVVSTTVPPPNQCVASAEVIDTALAATTVLIPGSVAHSPVAVFGLMGITELQTARLNVVAFPPDPCIGELSFVNSQGAQVGNALSVQLAPGQAAFLDLHASALGLSAGQRAEVRPVVTGQGCVASAELYHTAAGTTIVYFPPDPCRPSSTSCLVFQPTAVAALPSRRLRWFPS
jgi:hypothetical protein